MKLATLLAAPAFVLALAGAGFAAEHEVHMLNKGETGTMVFEPAFVKAEPGDTINFIPTDKSHNAESIPEMMPAGAAPFLGKMNEQIDVTFKEAGVYGIKCKPHYGMGMVALIVVGEPTNLEAAGAAKHPGKAKQVFADLVAKANQVAKAQ